MANTAIESMEGSELSGMNVDDFASTAPHPKRLAQSPLAHVVDPFLTAPLHKYLDLGAAGGAEQLAGAEWGLNGNENAEILDELLGLDAFDPDGGASAHRAQHNHSNSSSNSHSSSNSGGPVYPHQPSHLPQSTALTGAAHAQQSHRQPHMHAYSSDSSSVSSADGFGPTTVVHHLKAEPPSPGATYNPNHLGFFVPIKAPLSPPDSSKSSSNGSDDETMQQFGGGHDSHSSSMERSPPPMPLDGTYQMSPLGQAAGQKRGADSDSGNDTEKPQPECRQKKKTAHNAIERKYRNSINDGINDLKACLPADMLRHSKTRSKAAILNKCLDYIQHLEKSNNVLRNENRVLKAQLGDVNGVGVGGGPTAEGAAAGTRHLVTGGSEMGKALLCVAACGVVFVGSSTLGGAAVAGGENNEVAAPTHGGGRVLRSIPDGGESGVLTPLEWVGGMLLPWILRFVMLTVGMFLLFTLDRVTDSAGAKEHEEKCAVAVVNGDSAKAKHHALKSLALLGQPVPTTPGATYLQVVLALFRQLSHRCIVGQVLESVMTRRTKAAMEATVIVANVNHMLHQLLIQEGKSNSVLNGVNPAQKYLTSLTMLQSVNAAEAASGGMDPVALIRVYVAAAAEVHLSFQSDFAAGLANRYLSLARDIFHSCAEDVPTLAWLFKPEGDAYFRSRKWCQKVAAGPDGDLLRPGSLEQLGLAYRADLLEQGLLNFFEGTNTQGVEDMFCDLRQCAEECGDPDNEWWAAMGLVVVSWRHGKTSHARQVFCDVDQMENRKTKLQQFVYVACRAHQALLDDNHTLCWQALGLASTLAGDINAEQSPADGQTMHQLGCLLAYHHLLSTRVALLRLRTYLGQQTPEGSPTILVAGEQQLTNAVILEKLQVDVTKLRQFSTECQLATPSAHLYQAIHRSLVGGRVSSTEHIFHQSIKSARQLKMPYDEASAMLHAAIHLRSSMAGSEMKSHLTKAATIFEQLNASDELCTARKILHVVA
jgi:hypothetical protein